MRSPNTGTYPILSTRSHSTLGEGTRGEPSYKTTAAPVARADTSQFHIIQPTWNRQRSSVNQALASSARLHHSASHIRLKRSQTSARSTRFRRMRLCPAISHQEFTIQLLKLVSQGPSTDWPGQVGPAETTPRLWLAPGLLHGKIKLSEPPHTGCFQETEKRKMLQIFEAFHCPTREEGESRDLG